MQEPSSPASAAVTVLGNEASVAFRKLVELQSGENVMQCYQCGECTAGCPVAFEMDLTPNQVMRMVQLGLKEPVLESSSIWLCAGCETCATRCPRLVQLSKIMDALRQIAVAEGKVSEKNILAFHKIFVDAIGMHGRVHEVGMLGRLKMTTRDLFTDMGLGMRMFFKGKLKMMPDKIKGVDEVRNIIKKTTTQSPPPSRRGQGGGQP
jgi:heterodisulfide reductase subunit C2